MSVRREVFFPLNNSATARICRVNVRRQRGLWPALLYIGINGRAAVRPRFQQTHSARAVDSAAVEPYSTGIKCKAEPEHTADAISHYSRCRVAVC